MPAFAKAPTRARSRARHLDKGVPRATSSSTAIGHRDPHGQASATSRSDHTQRAAGGHAHAISRRLWRPLRPHRRPAPGHADEQGPLPTGTGVPAGRSPSAPRSPARSPCSHRTARALRRPRKRAFRFRSRGPGVILGLVHVHSGLAHLGARSSIGRAWRSPPGKEHQRAHAGPWRPRRWPPRDYRRGSYHGIRAARAKGLEPGNAPRHLTRPARAGPRA